MAHIDDMLKQYIIEEYEGVFGEPITAENYLAIIRYLREQERNSYGIVKRTDVITFLERWFGDEV